MLASHEASAGNVAAIPAPDSGMEAVRPATGTGAGALRLV